MLSSLRLTYWLSCCILLTASACKKDSESGPGLCIVNKVPYYHFTEDDQPWLTMRQGDTWQFENVRGYRRTYQISQVIDYLQAEKKEVQPPGPNFSSPKLLNYFDQKTVRLTRTDSMRGGGEFRFYRGASQLTSRSSDGYDKNKSSLYAKGEWSDFVGNTDLISDYYSCRGLKFPRESALKGPFEQLTIRGRQYTDVIVFTGTSRGSTCASTSASFIQELYYDRRAGIVRMVSLGGEVWDRLP
ncbi:hypothetical protein [Hymenobacter yonginensis]|uniref:Uncharacterized protein n=1 Tax=Hymenobacter yonginensis TaxID=748197 RepID=A0ABY7PUG3_9BACT|nr:hypothetical protein [Hymenobacter yonginensis]WBO86577.1 hypothetical protein O9Z63_10015 [Hymenobacter yonginensis]